jgi:hypothetical protein
MIRSDFTNFYDELTNSGLSCYLYSLVHVIIKFSSCILESHAY